MGHIISAEKTRLLINQTEVIFNIATLRTVEDVKEFLGKVNYFRKFIKNCADTCQPLTKLLQKIIKFEWRDIQI